jgi:hypothetical protein
VNVASTAQADWVSGGVQLHEGRLGQNSPTLAADGANGVVVAWEDYRNGDQGDIYAQRVLLDGTIAPGWPAEGLAVVSTGDDQYSPTLARDGTQAVLATWVEAPVGHAGSYLKAQPVVDLGFPVLISATATPAHVRILWQARNSAVVTFNVERRLKGQAWAPLSSLHLGPKRRVALDDQSVDEGVHAEYRLSYRDSAETVHLQPVALDVPVAPKVLTLHAVVPHGAQHSLAVVFSLPRGPTPLLDLLDVMGRRVTQQRLDGLEAGEQNVAFTLPTALPAGVYFLRLVQGKEQRVAKTVYIR